MEEDAVDGSRVLRPLDESAVEDRALRPRSAVTPSDTNGRENARQGENARQSENTEIVDQSESLEKPKQTRVKLASMNASSSPDVEVTEELEHGTPVLSIGRAESNTLALKDQRVSYKHFLIRARMRLAEDKENEQSCTALELVDLSTNGTWVNNYRVGKGKIVPISTGDEIQILPVTKVGRAQMIGYTLQTNIGQQIVAETPNPHNQSGVLERPKWVSCDAEARVIGGSPQFKKSGLLDLGDVKSRAKDDSQTFASELELEVTCGICADILHKSVALIPCLHNFCTACYLEWRHRSNDCPNCRAQVVTILRNHAIDGVVNTFTKAHPSRKRDPAELEELDRKEEDPLNRLLLNRLLSRRVTEVTRDRRRDQQNNAHNGPAETPRSSYCTVQ
jgi:E3 ubiquitin-protein ligase CHFR